MLNEKQLRELSNQATGKPETMASMDQKLNKNIQQREIAKIRDSFYDAMKTHYQVRKSREFITLKCSNLCFNKGGDNFLEDDMTRFEKNCMLNCFHKTFRYLVHANTVYSFLTGDPEMIQEFIASGSDELIDTGSVNKPVMDAEGN